jgi:hypothetical protein
MKMLHDHMAVRLLTATQVCTYAANCKQGPAGCSLQHQHPVEPLNIGASFTRVIGHKPIYTGVYAPCISDPLHTSVLHPT